MQFSFSTHESDTEFYIPVPLARYEQLITAETTLIAMMEGMKDENQDQKSED